VDGLKSLRSGEERGRERQKSHKGVEAFDCQTSERKSERTSEKEGEREKFIDMHLKMFTC